MLSPIQPGIYRIVNLATNTALETSAARVLSIPLSVSEAYSDSPTDLEYWRLTPGSVHGTFMFTSVVLLRKPTYYEGIKGESLYSTILDKEGKKLHVFGADPTAQVPAYNIMPADSQSYDLAWTVTPENTVVLDTLTHSPAQQFVLDRVADED